MAMTFRARRTVVLWGLVLLSLAAGANATPARVAALLGNALFEDDTNSDLYPSLAARYGRSASLHLTGGAGTRAGLIYGGDRWLVGASYGAPPAYDDLTRIGEELGRPILRPTRLLNVLVVRKLEDDSAFAFALNPAFGITRSFPLGAPITNTLLERDPVRPHLPQLALAITLTCACGPTGPDTRSGISACDQLRECSCDPSRTFDPGACNAMVDLLEADVDAQRLCSQRLTLFGCGRGLQVNPPGF